MNAAGTDEATLRSLTERYDAIQVAAFKSIESPVAAKAQLDALEATSPLTPAETIVFWTKLTQRSLDGGQYTETVKYAHVRLVQRILAYFDVPLP